MEGRCRLPAAMAAGVVDTLMSFEDLFDAVMGEGYTPPLFRPIPSMGLLRTPAPRSVEGRELLQIGPLNQTTQTDGLGWDAALLEKLADGADELDQAGGLPGST